MAIAVPTELFTFMREVTPITREETVTLALDEDGPYFLFSLLSSGDHLYDLWLYTANILPKWLRNPDYYLP